jgi:hypothetical protein
MLKGENNFEVEFSEILFQNSIRFIDAGIGFINKGLDNYTCTVQAIVNIQLAMELALKSSIVSDYGIRTILKSSQNQMPNQEIEELFQNNRLKTREYNDIKNFAKSNSCCYDFDKKEYKCMENFQRIRNGILHSSYIFSDEETEHIEKDIYYTLIHILGVLMSEDASLENRTFMQEYLNHHEYSKLLNNPKYVKELYRFLENEYDKLYICPYCSTSTMTPEHKCVVCFGIFKGSSSYAYVDCGYCGEHMVICDAANIENNNNMIRGLCMNCREDTIVYKCNKCGEFINLESFDFEECREDHCKYD